MRLVRWLFAFLCLFTVSNVSAQNINTPENFPDPKFRAVVEEFVGVEPGGEFSADDAEKIRKALHCPHQGIADLSGIEFFSRILELDCSDNLLTNIELSANVDLRVLDCSYNQLEQIDCSSQIGLDRLDCSFNQLTELNFSHNENLNHLDCSNNLLRNLNVASNIKLQWLLCEYNHLMNLDVLSLNDLRVLFCGCNQLQSLDLSSVLLINALDCRQNEIAELTLSRLSELIYLDCSHNNLTELDLGPNPLLQYVRCQSNQLTALSIPVGSDIRTMDCSWNRLTDIATFINNQNFEQYDSVDIRYNYISEERKDELEIFENRIGDPFYFGYADFLYYGFSYLPQRDSSDGESLNEEKLNLYPLAVREGNDLIVEWRSLIDPDRITIYAGTSPNEIDCTVPIAQSNSTVIRITGLNPGIRYYFETVAENHDRIIFSERRIPFTGTCNTRDMGGYTTADGRRVKWGLLYRSDELSLMQRDFELFSNLGVKMICDFRTPSQIEEEPNRLPENLQPMIVNIPVEGENPLYPSYVLTYREEFSQFFQLLSNPDNLPFMFHCRSGMDRTGFAAVMFLFALDVPLDTALDDYLMTNIYRYEYDTGSFFKSKAWLNANNPDLIDLGYFGLAVNVSNINAAYITILEQFGSVENYLEEALGVDRTMREQLREIYLEPEGITGVPDWMLNG